MSYKEKYQKAKTHVQEHKAIYILGGVCFAGISYIIMRENSDLLCGSDSELLRGSEARSLFLFSKVTGDQTTKAVTTIHTGSKGHPGFVTRSIETGELFANQNDAARAFDIPPSI
ncbi:MAG TPA: hypothetical protein VN843_21675, partial [Anaerolineales bacterium]|nr:hypothetical protein [Anaerolineales bacterium]